MSRTVPQAAEITLRGTILGALITVVFTAANVYLGLKVGLTFASSIPAAVISMVVLRAAGGGTVLENNAVQTEASAAGTLSSVIFVIPGLVMIGHWHGFPWFETAGICAAGAVLGVLFTIPLRRALVVESALPFPEGVAAAAVLQLGAAGAGRGARVLGLAALAAGAVNIATGGLALLADGVGTTLGAGGALFRLATGFSPALLGAGYLMGPAAGVAVLIGIVAGWGVAVPILTAHDVRPTGLADTAWALATWSHQVRLIGAGTIAVASVWTLAALAPSILRALRTSFGPARGPAGAPVGVARTDLDLSGRAVALCFAGAFALLLVCFLAFLPGAPWRAAGFALFAVVFGFVVAAACGVMSGIVGSSASPISGIAILAVALASLVLLALPAASGAVPLALFATSAVLAIATISNDNLQDLKTGLLVGATPARQQVALMIGGFAGAAVIPPVLDLLYNAYGFTGALPRPGMNPAAALAAPQATLMTTLAEGILGHRLDWTMIGIGLAFGAVLVAADAGLRRRGFRLPVIATGLGLYLPPSIGMTLVIGAALSFAAARLRRRLPAGARDDADRGGTLAASGLIVGESLAGVLVAAVVAFTGHADAIAVVGPGFASTATALGAVAFVAIAAGFIRAAAR